MWLINLFEAAIKYRMMNTMTIVAHKSYYIYLTLSLKQYFLLPRSQVLLKNQACIIMGSFGGFFQLPVRSHITFLLMLLGTGSGLSLLELLHIVYVLQYNDGRCRWVECDPTVFLICYKCSSFHLVARWVLKIS